MLQIVEPDIPIVFILLGVIITSLIFALIALLSPFIAARTFATSQSEWRASNAQFVAELRAELFAERKKADVLEQRVDELVRENLLLRGKNQEIEIKLNAYLEMMSEYEARLADEDTGS